MVAASADSFAKACALIERAIDLGGPSARYLAQLARCRAMLKRDAGALEAAEQAIALGSDAPLTLDTIGVVLSRIGAHQRAAEIFGKAVELSPDNATFRYNLASSLRFAGRFDAAEQAYEAAVRIDATFYRAHSALASLRKHSADDNHIERLLGLLPGVGDDAHGELHLRQALAKEYEDLGDCAAAFEHLAAGRAKMRRRLDYSIDTDRALFATVERLFDRRRFESAAAGCDSREPIFIVGMPRTGTTLVDRILSSHPDVMSAGELQNFGLCLKKASGVVSRRVLDAATLEAGAGADMAALGRAYVDSTRFATGRTPRFIDKLPLNFFYIGFIALALPNARIVCLRRDPLDACLSNFRQLFAIDFQYYHYAYDLEDIGRYYAMFDHLMAHWRRILPGHVLELRYEDLVRDQEAETRRLLEYCELDWDPRCLDFHDNEAPVATPSSVQVRRRLNADAIGRWRRYEGQLGPLKARLAAAGLLEAGAV